MAEQFEGVASSTCVDRQGDKLSEEALRRVAQSGPVKLVLAHQGQAEVVGRIEQWQLKGNKLYVQGTLQPQNAQAQALVHRLRNGERLGLSLGGRIKRWRWGWDAHREGPVRYLEEIVVEHVAVCRAAEAVNPDVRLRLLSPKAEQTSKHGESTAAKPAKERSGDRYREAVS